MKTFYKIAVLVISVSASATSFAGDNDWQHERDGGSYSNANSGRSDNNGRFQPIPIPRRY